MYFDLFSAYSRSCQVVFQIEKYVYQRTDDSYMEIVIRSSYQKTGFGFRPLLEAKTRSYLCHVFAFLISYVHKFPQYRKKNSGFKSKNVYCCFYRFFLTGKQLGSRISSNAANSPRIFGIESLKGNPCG